MNGKRCCFYGNGMVENSLEMYERARSKIIHLIENENVVEFWTGTHTIFDNICAKCVMHLRDIYKDIKLVYIERNFISDKESYLKIYDEIHRVNIPYNLPSPLGVYRYNEYMVAESDFALYFIDDYCYDNGIFYIADKLNVKMINVID